MGVQTVPNEHDRGLHQVVHPVDQADVVLFGHAAPLVFAAGVPAQAVAEPGAVGQAAQQLAPPRRLSRVTPFFLQSRPRVGHDQGCSCSISSARVGWFLYEAPYRTRTATFPPPTPWLHRLDSEAGNGRSRGNANDQGIDKA